VKVIAGEIVDRATGAIAARVGSSGASGASGASEASEASGASGASHGFVVFNAGSHARSDLVELDPSAGGLREEDAGTPLIAVPAAGDERAPSPVQRLADGGLGFVATVPGCGWARYDLRPAGAALPNPGPAATPAPAAAVADEDGFELSNTLLTARVTPDGTLASLVDHATGRQLIATGSQGNVFQLHHDLPNDADAWDVDQGTFNRATEIRQAESIGIVESGPMRAAIRVVHVFGSSRISQDIRITAGSRRLEFVTDVEWGERHRFLKVAFPLAVRAPSASYEIQFGYIQRPTHANTTWDAARFEVPAQRWADLSEPGCGAALLNDCKYGYDVRGSVMRLSLLRGPTWPDPDADKGRHRFSYALLPHGGLASSLQGSGSVVDEAEGFNLGLRAVPVHAGASATPLPARASIVDVKGAMVSSVKRADRSEELVVRVFEPAGAHGHVELVLGEGGIAPNVSAARTDLLERDLAPVEVSPTGAVELALKPFELVTLKLTSGKATGAG
jgi:alpha-mannosidase